jgi:hypothetical protein
MRGGEGIGAFRILKVTISWAHLHVVRGGYGFSPSKGPVLWQQCISDGYTHGSVNVLYC